MTRFVFVTDTHYGAAPMAWGQQPGAPERLPALVSALDRWLRDRPEVACVVHGGDLVDRSDPLLVTATREIFRVSRPVYLCLGNHDLTTPGALPLWRETAPRFLPEGEPTYTVALPDLRLHVVPTQWSATPWLWDPQGAQETDWLAEQQAFLKAALAERPDLPHVLVTHAPVFGVTAAQTGLAEEVHAPTAGFTAMVTAVAAAHPQLRLVLGGHTHMNSCRQVGHTWFATGASWAETPHECKLVEVDGDRVAMRTIRLPGCGGLEQYDFDKAHVQGRAIDRGFGELAV